jgi:hypothetical protein
MEGILAGLTAFNTLSPMVLALIAELRSKDPRTDEEIIAAARAKVAEIKRITEEDMSDKP